MDLQLAAAHSVIDKMVEPTWFIGDIGSTTHYRNFYCHETKTKIEFNISSDKTRISITYKFFGYFHCGNGPAQKTFEVGEGKFLDEENQFYVFGHWMPPDQFEKFRLNSNFNLQEINWEKAVALNKIMESLLSFPAWKRIFIKEANTLLSVDLQCGDFLKLRKGLWNGITCDYNIELESKKHDFELNTKDIRAFCRVPFMISALKAY